MLRSPFKFWKRIRHGLAGKRLHTGDEEHREHPEPYRQPFGREYTRNLGRPIGWVLLMSAIEKIGFPTALLILVLLQMWEPLAITLAAEAVLSLSLLTIAAKGRRLEFFGKGLLVTPLRYASLGWDLVTIGGFASDIWITRNKRWRK